MRVRVQFLRSWKISRGHFAIFRFWNPNGPIWRWHVALSYPFPFFLFTSLFSLNEPIRALYLKRQAISLLHQIFPATAIYRLPSHHAISFFFFLSSFFHLLSMTFFIRASPMTHGQHAPDQRASHAIKVGRRWSQPLMHCQWAGATTKPSTHLHSFSTISRRPFVIFGQHGYFLKPHSKTFRAVPILPQWRLPENLHDFPYNHLFLPLFQRTVHFCDESTLDRWSSFCSLQFKVYHAYVWRSFKKHILRGWNVNLSYVSICMQD